MTKVFARCTVQCESSFHCQMFSRQVKHACHRILTSESSAGHDLPQLSQKPSPSTGRRSHELGRTAAAVKRTATVERNKSRFSEIVSHFHRGPRMTVARQAAMRSVTTLNRYPSSGDQPVHDPPGIYALQYSYHSHICVYVRTYSLA